MSKKLCHRKILQTLRKHFCQLKIFSNFQKKFRLKSDEKKISKVELCYTESFWHVESSFDSFAWNFSQTFCNIFAPNPKTFEKLYTFRKKFQFIKFLHKIVNFCFDHAVKKTPRIAKHVSIMVPNLLGDQSSEKKFVKKILNIFKKQYCQRCSSFLDKKSKNFCSKFQKY